MEDNIRDKRHRALEFGAFAEEKAAEHYVSQGYAILERNWILGKIEIDVIARKEDVIAFVEVKARSGRDQDAFETVTYDKMKRMARGAHAYLKKTDGNVEYRFDVFTVTGDTNDYVTEVFEDAFLSPLF